MAEKIEISRIQNRRGLRRDLPQPLKPGEFGLCLDTGELFIGLNAEIGNLAVVTGLSLYVPVPVDGENKANLLLTRVLIGETVEISNDITAVEIRNGLLGLENYVGSGAYASYTMTNPDVIDTVVLEEISRDDDLGTRKVRVYIGIYEMDNASTPVPIEIEGAGGVRENLMDVQLNGMGQTLISVDGFVNISGSFVNNTLSGATLNGEPLLAEQYGHIGWIVNHVYVESGNGLVSNNHNLQVLTSIAGAP